jgi:hypothetical protein
MGGAAGGVDGSSLVIGVELLDRGLQLAVLGATRAEVDVRRDELRLPEGAKLDRAVPDHLLGPVVRQRQWGVRHGHCSTGIG